MVNPSSLSPFHLAIPVWNLEECRIFYADILECPQGRSSTHWVDFDLFGHQLVIHYKPKNENQNHSNEVDGKQVPVPHFGVVLPWKTFHDFAEKLKQKGIQFVIEPYIRFEGEVGEQATLFFLDPSENALEFKAFKNPNRLFAK